MRYNEEGIKMLKDIILIEDSSCHFKDLLNKRNKKYSAYLNRTEKNRDSLNQKALLEILGERFVSEMEQYTQLIIERNQYIIDDCEKTKKDIEVFVQKLINNN